MKARSPSPAMFEAYAKGGDNARMKQFANELLPTLKTHSTMRAS